MKFTRISWAHHTHNPWRGCSKVSEGCRHCFAESQGDRFDYMPEWGPGRPRIRSSESTRNQPRRWDKEAAEEGRRARVFCGSLCDVFDPEVDCDWRKRLFRLIEFTPNLDWQLLTKRPHLIQRQLEEIGYWEKLPMPNVWIGVSAEDQKSFDQRWPILREIPAKVRFMSCEPLLGSIVLPDDAKGKLHWLICGGETTLQRDVARAMNPDWARFLRDQCADKGIAYFFKQHGNRVPRAEGSQPWIGKGAKYYKEHTNLLDGMSHHAFPVTE